VLTKEIAQQHLKNSWSTRLDGFNSADPEAIEVLSKEKGDLVLRGLRSLTPEIAELLADHRGMLWLDGIEEVSEPVAAPLARHEGGLSLSGLRSLSGSVAASLAHSQGMLGLSGLRELSDADAKTLVVHKGLLMLDGLEIVSDALAETLSEHEGGLCLGAKTLSDRAAEFLSKTRGELQMWKLASLSDSPAQLGLLEKLTMNEENVAALPGLLSLSDAAAEFLANFDGQIILNSIESLSGPAGKLIEKIYDQEDGICLAGLRSLPDDVAEKLSKRGVALDLSGLQSLSDGAAAALSSHEGDLNLSGLKNLSQATVAAIAKHQGQVYLDPSVSGQMEAALPPLRNPVAIGITDPNAPRWKGTAKFIICWDLEVDSITDFGEDPDAVYFESENLFRRCSEAAVLYDFSTGQASDLIMVPALAEQGVAIPYLASGITIMSAFPQDGHALLDGDEDTDPKLHFEQEWYSLLKDGTSGLLEKIIRAVHAHAVEMIPSKENRSCPPWWR